MQKEKNIKQVEPNYVLPYQNRHSESIKINN